MKSTNSKFTESHQDISAALQVAREALENKSKEKEVVTAQLARAVQDLARQIEEKEKRVQELDAVNRELAFQISEKEKKEAQLRAANHELESFSYSVSHDLRTPLRAIYGFSQVLLEDFVHQMDEEAQTLFAEIIENTRKMGDLIDNLLEYARINKQNVFQTKIDVQELVETLVQELKQLYPERHISVSLKKLPEMQGDHNMIKQVFSNLLSNSFKYTGKKEKSVIEVGSYTEQDEIVYFVKDNGAGFDERYYNKLFGVFQRLHSSTEFEGTGVGLAIVEKIVHKHQGRVWAEGKLGEGACFFISFPSSNT
ncbi:GHKL domain-containing protein [Psychroflexus sp. YR1-1]|uniref:histidine kinase n=1 Tax=Psychroflexus aurantiacus TaxID=2709310 RepID=A0A6B3R4X5_9FLAO|nr:ATP-binding protein [Psychroflexus aurantiacus]NEV94005.1 GHKL domain-containing protein [Psychroflexus aurantiacus]